MKIIMMMMVGCDFLEGRRKVRLVSEGRLGVLMSFEIDLAGEDSFQPVWLLSHSILD